MKLGGSKNLYQSEFSEKQDYRRYIPTHNFLVCAIVGAAGQACRLETQVGADAAVRRNLVFLLLRLFN